MRREQEMEGWAPRRVGVPAETYNDGGTGEGRVVGTMEAVRVAVRWRVERTTREDV